MFPLIQAGSSKARALTGLALSAGFALCVLMPDIALAQNAHAHVVLDPNFRTPAPPNCARCA